MPGAVARSSHVKRTSAMRGSLLSVASQLLLSSAIEENDVSEGEHAHRNHTGSLSHCGLQVHFGAKYVLRADVLFGMRDT